MPGDSQFDRSDNFFGVLNTESCRCGHNINITDSGEHTCSVDCLCPSCKEIIGRQLRVIEED